MPEPVRETPKPKPARRGVWLRVAVAGLFLFLVLRVVWTARQMELGLSTLARGWRDSVLESVGFEQLAIDERKPEEQAKFWLAETKRVTAENPNSAKIAMGAALLLDSRKTHLLIYNGGYDFSVGQECVALAKRATDLEPQEVNWWRMRAMQMFDYGYESPRATNWRDIIQQCAEHDPNNGLYDYLIAMELWRTSSEPVLDEKNLRTRLSITDVARFSEGVASFNRGQEKDFVALGERGFSAVTDFLDCTQVPLQDHAAIAGDWRSMFLRLYRRQQYRADTSWFEGDFQQEFILVQQNLHAAEQFMAGDELTSSFDIGIITVNRDCRRIVKLLDDHPELANAAYREAIEVKYADYEEDLAAWQQMWRSQGRIRVSRERALMRQTVLLYLFRVSGFRLMMAGLAAALFGRFLRRKRALEAPSSLGLPRSLLAWIAASLLTFWVFGVIPTLDDRYLSLRVTAAVFFWSVVACMVYLLFRTIVKRRRSQRGVYLTLRDMFVITLASCVALAVWRLLPRDGLAWFGGWVAVEAALFCISQTEPVQRRRWLALCVWGAMVIACVVAVVAWSWMSLVPQTLETIDNLLTPLGWKEFESAAFQRCFDAPNLQWQWTVFQWLRFCGVYVTVALALSFTCWWRMVRRARRNSQAIRAYWREDGCDRWGRLLGGAGRSTAIAGACCLAVALWLTPFALETMEADFQEKMQSARDPDQRLADLRKMFEDIKAENAALLKGPSAVGGDEPGARD